MSEKRDTLPQGWEWKKWNDTVNIKNGKDYKSISNKNGTYPIYGSGGIIGYVDEYLCNENSVIVGRKGTINNPLFVKEKFWNIDTAFGLEAKQDKLEPLFLYYFCLNFDFLQLNTATTLPSLTKSKLQEINIPLPPLEEQRRIVGVLDGLFGKIDKSIALLDESIASASTLMPSALNEVFEELGEKWEKKKFEDIAFIKGGKRVPKGKKLTEQKTEYPYIRVSDFTDNGTIDISRLQYITKDIYDEIKNYTITCEDLYISIAGTIGKTGIIPKELNGANLTENAAKFVYKIDLVNKYVYYFTLSSIFQEQAGFATKIVAMPKLALTRLSKIEIPLPPLDIQTQTVAYLDALHVKADALKKAQEKKKEALLALKASLLESAFKGEL